MNAPRWNIAQRLTAVFALGPIALIIIGVIAYHNTREIVTTAEALAHSTAVQLSIDHVAARMIDAETGERGFLLTGRESYLEPYRLALANVGRAINDFASLTTGDAVQQAHVAELRPLIQVRFGQLTETIQTRRAKGLPSAAAVVIRNNSKPTMDTIRGILGDAATHEADIQSERQAAVQEVLTRTTVSILVGTVLTILVLALSGWAVIRSVSVPVEEMVAALTSATAEILAGTSQQASGVQEQAAAMAETSSTVEEIAQTAEQASQRARAVAGSSQRATENSLAGRRAVESARSAMAEAKTRTETAAQSILSLAEQAQAIGEITAFVNDVADQTNILALNASIEASRAGEQGKGFNVVAAEIKELAAQSKKSTHQIRQILSDIEKATGVAVFATEAGNKAVDRAMQTVNEADDVIRSLSDTILEAAQSSLQITASTGQQAIGITQIQQAMESIRNATNQNLEATLQAEKSARNLDTVGMRLRVLLRGAAV